MTCVGGRQVVLPSPSPALLETYGYTDELAEILEVELDRHLGLLMLDWLVWIFARVRSCVRPGVHMCVGVGVGVRL